MKKPEEMSSNYFERLSRDHRVPKAIKVELFRLWRLTEDRAVTAAVRRDAQRQLEALLKAQRATEDQRRSGHGRRADSEREARQADAQSKEPRVRMSYVKLNAQLAGLRNDVRQLLLKDKTKNQKGT